MRFSYLLGGVALAAMMTTSPICAQSATVAAEPVQADAQVTDESNAQDIIVTGEIIFRNRTADPNPVLSYDLEYFQRFEPVSVGEMLKRVPGVTFTSDVLEYDGVQMRGLPPGFTQVLINGRRAPGGEADGSFFVDRLPAELVERIEIVRAPRADQPSEGVAGTLNVVTKEAVSFEGGFVKAGALINEDGGVRPSGAIAYAGKIGDATSFWAGLNYQERRNPKKKVSYRFGGFPTTDDDRRFPGDPTTSDFVGDPAFDNFEAQDDTRDGRDISGNVELTTRFGEDGFFRIAGLFVDTDRDEDETSVTLEGEDLDFDEVEIQQERIGQQTFAVTADSRIPLGFAQLGLAAGWSGFREDTAIEVFVGDNGDDLGDVELDDEETVAIDDDEYSGTVSLTFGSGGAFEIKPGIDLLKKERQGGQAGSFLASDFTIDEDRYAPYVRATFEPSDTLTIDAGLRYEITRREVNGVQVTEVDDEDVETLVSASSDDEDLNPSLHVRWSPTAVDQFRASVARTIRRPDYDLISPIEEDETPGDEDRTRGNPLLRNQKAWGVDVGYERRLGTSGIVGINFFYRDISDLVELVAIEDIVDDGETIGNVFTPQNIGDGETWGVEVDFSAPLTSFGLADTGLFANYTYLDSSTRDPFTGEERRFNNQPAHIYNAGFIQTVRSADVSFGASISGRSKATESNFDELISLRYDPDLEAFVEKRFGRNFVLRLSAQNLLDRIKKEDFQKFDGDSFEEILDARAAGDIDEYEIERERAGQLFQVTLRAAF